MSNQISSAFTKIDNSLFELLGSKKINREEFIILACIGRWQNNSNGFEASNTYLAKAGGMSVQGAKNVVKSLVDKQLIIKGKIKNQNAYKTNYTEITKLVKTIKKEQIDEFIELTNVIRLHKNKKDDDFTLDDLEKLNQTAEYWKERAKKLMEE